MKNFNAKILILCLLALWSQQIAMGQSACTLDPAWVGDGMLSADYGHEANEMLLLPDGRLLAVCNNSWQAQTQIKCYNPDGSLDPTYGTAGTLSLNIGEAVTEVYSLCYRNGTVYLAGTADSMGAWQHFYAFIAALTVDGNYVTQFGQNGVLKFKTGNHNFDHIKSIISDANGDLYVAGVQWYDTFFVAKVTATGQMVNTWGNGGVTKVGGPAEDRWWRIRDIELDKNNQLVVTGKYSGNINNGLVYFQHLLVARFNTNGNLDNTFANNGIGLYNSAPDISNEGKVIMITPNNDYVITGTYYIWDDMTAAATTTKVLHNGAIDNSFGTNGWVVDQMGSTSWNENEIGAKQLPDGHFMVAVTHFVGYTYYFTITLLNMDGSVDSSFGNNGVVMTLIDTDNRCFLRSMELDVPQGKIYLGGYSQYCSQTCGPPYIAIARFNYTFAPPIVAISAPAAGSLIVSPNPTHSGGRLRLSGLDEAQISAMELWDVSGKRMPATRSSMEMQLPSLPAGIYFLRVTTADAVLTQKVVVD